MEYMTGRTSPELFKKWTGIFCVGAALERRVWLHIEGQNLYPTQYILFVAPSGTGKSNSTSVAQQLLNSDTGLQRAPTSLSRASIIDALAEASRTVINHGTGIFTSFNSLYLIANELGVLIPQYDPDFMSTLTDIYDGKPYEERKRTKDVRNTIEAPQINMLAGTTPSYLGQMMPEGAWDQGFISRVILVWADQAKRQDPFDVTALPERLRIQLTNDLKTMTNIKGKALINEDVKDEFRAWLKDGMPPSPSHPRLSNYLTRRHTHLMKLCMICSVSRTLAEDTVINMEDYLLAKDLLIEVEHEMQKIFPAMASGGDAKNIDDIWHQLVEMYKHNLKPIPKQRVYDMLSARLPTHSVDRGYDIMIKRGLIKEEHVNKLGIHLIPQQVSGPDRK